MLKPHSYRAFLMLNSAIVGSLKRLGNTTVIEPHPQLYDS